MILSDVILKVIEEQNINTSKTRPIIDAIKNRKKISFYYKGPTRPKKTSVKPGYRVKAEAVALGLSKKGNLVIRAFVKPPSTSKKGFLKTGWRTFMVSRISGLQVTDDVFNEKRPGYNEGDDKSLTVTYAKSNWEAQPQPKPVEKPKTGPVPQPRPEPPVSTEPEKPETGELPQPKPVEKPQAEPTPQEEKPEPEELPQPKPEEKPSENPEDNEDENLMENIKRIKGLMLLLN